MFTVGTSVFVCVCVCDIIFWLYAPYYCVVYKFLLCIVTHSVNVALYCHTIIQLLCMFCLLMSPGSTSSRAGVSRTSYPHNKNIFTCSFFIPFYYENACMAFKIYIVFLPFVVLSDSCHAVAPNTPKT